MLPDPGIVLVHLRTSLFQNEDSTLAVRIGDGRCGKRVPVSAVCTDGPSGRVSRVEREQRPEAERDPAPRARARALSGVSGDSAHTAQIQI